MVKLDAKKPPMVDVIAQGFENSTQKKLKYIEPEFQNGEVVVGPSLNVTLKGSPR